MDILKNEICKLLTKRTVSILLLLIVINPLLQLYIINTSNEDGYSLKDYSELYHKISSSSQDDLLAEIEEEKIKADTFGEANLYVRVYEEAKACITYDEYLNSIDEKAEEIAIMNSFVDNDGYAVRNAEKTSKVYQKLKGTELKVEDPMGILNITDNEFTDYIAIIMIFIIAINLVFYEKNENQFCFLRTTSNGRKKLMASKVLAMVLFVLLITISLYGMNAVISRCFFNPIDFETPLQSLYLYRKSPFCLNIGEFLVSYFLVKILSCVLLGILFMLICAIFNHIIFVFVVSALTVLVEIICYTKISGTHFLAFLKYLNIVSGVKTGGMFSDYVNLSVIGYPVNTCFLYGILWLILTVVFAFTVINYLESSHEKRIISLQGFDFLKDFECHTSLFLHECHKMLVPGRGFWVLIFSCLFVIWWNPAERIQFDTVDEVYYKEYMDKFYGPLNSKSYEMLNEERANYDQMLANISADIGQGNSENYISIKYKDKLSRQDAFDMVTEHVEYLESQKGGWLFYEKGYDILTDNNHFKNRDISQAFVYIIILIAITCGIYGVDFANSEMRILRTTYHGRRNLKNIKGILGVLCTLISFVLVYIVRLLNVLRAYGTFGLNASAVSMEHLSRVPQNISVLQYILIIMMMRFIGGLIVTKVVFVSFKYFKNSISVIISGTVIFIMPLALAAFDVPNAQYILFNPLLLGNVF
ncbi:MAG: ABC transporter permease [Lachnospiraceae bacterium]|nr:ABC transporter permease [Lachnospiraceae bacterium]